MTTAIEETMSVQDRAKEARRYFEQATRPDGGETYWRKVDDAPQWVYDLTLAAHDGGDILPDDWRYSFIVDALDLIADLDDEAEDSIEADTYTGELTAWLASSVNRVGYIDEALEFDGGNFNGEGFRLLVYAQHAERREVFHAVRSFLEELDA